MKKPGSTNIIMVFVVILVICCICSSCIYFTSKSSTSSSSSDTLYPTSSSTTYSEDPNPPPPDETPTSSSTYYYQTPTSSSTYYYQTPTSSSFDPGSSYAGNNGVITSISDKLYYGDRLYNSPGGSYLGFNTSGQLVFGTTVIAGSVITSPNRTTTYVELTKDIDDIPAHLPISKAKFGMELYQNGTKTYYKSIEIPKASSFGTVLLTTGTSSANPWIITKNGSLLLDASMTTSTISGATITKSM